jgi:hypothetical protein
MKFRTPLSEAREATYILNKIKMKHIFDMTQEEFEALQVVNIECTTTPREPYQFNMIKYFEDIGVKK